MLLGRFNLFRCDTCRVEAYHATFPPGWFWTKGGMERPTGHACGSCAEAIPDDVRGKPGQKYPVNDAGNSR